MAIEVVGRDDEFRALRASLDADALRAGPRAVALEGEAGIGKSTLWRAAIDLLAERGARVLVSRPAEAEVGFEHAALGDLFSDTVDEVSATLTRPQRRALEVALLLDDAAGETVDARALGVGLRSLLLGLAAERPLVLAIDDVQWMDPSSARALTFAVRRLPDTQLLLLWTRRAGNVYRPALEDAVAEDRVERVRVGALSLGAIQRILQLRLDHVFPRPTLVRLHESSAGNPFYALELARALFASGGGRPPGEPLPVPGRLEELVSGRLARFTGDARDALVLAASQPRLTLEHLARAGIGPEALDEAIEEQVVELAGRTVRFSHPLLASVLYQGLPPDERRRAHRRLADVLAEPTVRARHLALAADAPDEDLALVLEDAAAAARAPVAAADLAEHATRLTPGELVEDADRRAAAAARAHAAAGEVERARVLARGVLERAAPGPRRAEALELLADVESEDPGRAIPLLREALAEPDAPARLRSIAHQRLSLLVRFTEGLPSAERDASAAVELANDVGDDVLRAAATAALALITFNAGKEGALALAEQAHALAGRTSTPEPSFVLAHVLVWSGQFDRARTLLAQLHAEWSERDERIAAYALWYRSLVELRCGNLGLAGELADRSRELSFHYAREDAEPPQTLFPAALVAAHRGEFERARRIVDEMITLAARHGAHVVAPLATRAAIDHWTGNNDEAVRGFAAVEAIENPADAFDPGMCWWRAEQVEALLAAGRIDDAVARLDGWETDARRLGNAWALAHATRCRGLAASARGELGRAEELLETAIARHEERSDPFGRARALLLLGAMRRRGKQKRAAREAIEAAVAGFERIGADGWAAIARAEVGRIGGRTRADGLTPAERRVAQLVATGRTNAEVAAALFLTERTVASHLTRVYDKLGVRSRTELARTLD